MCAKYLKFTLYKINKNLLSKIATSSFLILYSSFLTSFLLKGENPKDVVELS